MRLAWIALLAGCWTASEPRRTPALDDDPPPPREPFPLRSKWRGTYVCSQGETAMYLELTARADGTLTGIFEFSPTPDNPGTATGVYRLAGKIRAFREGAFQIELDPLEWIQAPDGYIMVPLVATSSRKWGRLVGRMKHPNCGRLDVRRAD